MSAEPEFLPPPPRRLRPVTALRMLAGPCSPGETPSPGDLEERLRRFDGVLVEDDPENGTCVLSVVRRCEDPRERVVLFLDTLTHMHRQDLEPFLLERHEVAGRDLHVGAFELPRTLRTGLALLPVAPWDPETGRSRERWRAALERTEAPSSALEVFGGAGGGRSNLLSLPGALPQSDTDTAPPPGWAARLRSEMPTETLRSRVLGIEMTLWAQAPVGGTPEVTLIATDGDRYTGEYPLPPGLRRAQESGRIPPVGALYVAPTNPQDRATVLGMNPDLPAFLERELFPWARAHGVLTPDPGRRVVSGASLGGLAAADLVRRAPGTVGCAIVQSGSFWWPDGDPSEPEGLQLRLWQRDGAGLRQRVRIFHEVGTFEGHLLGDNRRFVAVLREQGVPVVAREFVGGHDYPCWRGGIIDGIAALFGPGKSSTRAGTSPSRQHA